MDETPETPSVPVMPAVVAALLHLGLLVLFLLPWRFDPSALVCVAESRAGTAGFEAVSSFQKGGYDGQFYYAIAQRAPWLPVAHREALDITGRHLRVLYPGLAWFLSTGDPNKLFLILPLLNLLAVGVLAYAGSVLAQARGLSPWWGLLLPIALNAGLPLFRDLTDLVGLAMLALLLVGWLENWSPRTLFALALAAMLARETVLIPLAFLGAAALVRRQFRPALALLAAAACWGLWAGYVCWLYGEWPFLPASGNVGRPFAGLVAAWQHTATATASRLDPVRLAAVTVVPLVVLVALLVRRRFEWSLGVVCAVGVGLAVLAGVSIWEDYWSYGRVLTVLPLGLWLACIHSRSRGLALAMSACGVLTLLAVARNAVA